jgi:hypothetical protein
MQSTLSLSQYVKRRNGVPLGDSQSMRNMFSRSLGAKSFPVFWYYWNPIWSFYLSRNVMRPLSNLLPKSMAIFITFLFSGGLHDLAVSLVKWKTIVFFTPWFGLMGLIVIISSKTDISYRKYSWPARAAINSTIIFTSLGLTYFLESVYT